MADKKNTFCEIPSGQLSARRTHPENHMTEMQKGSEGFPQEEESISSFEMPAVDGKFLDRIRDIQARGNPGLLENVLDLYLQETPQLLQLLRSASGRGDANGVQQAAHTLKSSSANLGGTRLAEMCQEVESLARSGEIPKARLLITRIEIEYRRVRAALKGER